MKQILLFSIALLSVLAVSCTSNAEMSRGDITLYVGQTAELAPMSGSASNWKICDQFVGSVDQNGKVTALHVGQATVSCVINGREAKSYIKVIPRINLWDEPYLRWQADMESVKRAEKRKLVKQDATTLLYESTGILGIGYTFSPTLMAAGAILPSTINDSTVKTFLLEQYTCMEENMLGMSMYMSGDGKTSIAYGVFDSFLIVMYMNTLDYSDLRFKTTIDQLKITLNNQ